MKTDQIQIAGEAIKHKAWCRTCKRDKTMEEMFCAVKHPDGIYKGACIECFGSGEIEKRWARLDQPPTPEPEKL